MGTAPQTIVSPTGRGFGRYDARPDRINPLDQWTGAQRIFRRMRLKEWIGFTLIHPQLYSSMVMQDAHYLCSSELYAFSESEGVLHQHARTGVGGTLALPERLSRSRARFSARGYELFYEFAGDDGDHRIEIHTDADAGGAAIDARLTLHGSAASAPLSVSSRLPGGLMFTHKRIFPVSGSYRMDGREFTFRHDRDAAILDEHKTFLPYRTRWMWATLATFEASVPLGVNLVARPELPGQEQESCIWAGGREQPVTEISFEPESPAEQSGSWRVRSADGRVQLRFTPRGVKRVRRQLLAAAIDYFQLFGSYTGTLSTADGEHRLDGVHGVLESMDARL